MRIFLTILFLLISTSAMAQSDKKIEAVPSDFRWENRILIIISDSENDVAVQKQLSNLGGKEAGMKDRDLITFLVFRNGISRLESQDLHTSSTEIILDKYGTSNPDFRIVLIGKDGGVKMQNDEPVSVDDIFGLIDSMPMRQREMRGDSER